MSEKRNMISQLRTRLLDFGATTLTRKEYDQLQAEWIMRTCPPSVIKAVRALEVASNGLALIGLSLVKGTLVEDISLAKKLRAAAVEGSAIHNIEVILSDPIIQNILAVPGHPGCCDICEAGGCCKADDHDNDPVVEESEEE